MLAENELPLFESTAAATALLVCFFTYLVGAVIIH